MTPFILGHELVGQLPAPHVHFLLHGVLGSGQNLRRLARDLRRGRPSHAFVLVDLRAHGRSLGAPPPHTLQACASDLRALAVHLGQAPTTLLGHSFGGKVALEYARSTEEQSHDKTLQQVWLLDSNPGSQHADEGHEVLQVLSAVKAVVMPCSSRAECVRQLLEQGLSEATARWLATNLHREGQVYRWSLDLEAMDALLRDYFARDLWGYLEQNLAGPELHLVIAERSDRWQPATRERAESLSAATHTHVHLLANAGHWLHVDNPEGLTELVLRFLVH